MASTTLRIVIQGVDNASGPIGKVNRALGSMATIAGGIISAQVINRITQGIGDIAGAAFGATADFERLNMVLQTLAARELLNTGQATSMAEALGLAAPRAQELVKWVQQLAIKSPFTEGTVATIMQTAMGYGMASEMAQDLTRALANFSAGTGRTESQVELLGLALGQVYAKGKLTGEEMRQLTNAGIGVNEIARALGISVGEVATQMAKGQITAQRLLPALIAVMNKDFAGAAERMSTSWAGLASTWEDIKAIGLREFFAGTFAAIQPLAQQFVAIMSDPATMAKLREWGTVLGTHVAGALQMVTRLFFAFQQHGVPGILSLLNLGPQANLFFLQLYYGIRDAAGIVLGALRQALDWLSQNALPLLNQALTFANQHWTELQGALTAVVAVFGVAMPVIGAVAAVVAALNLPLIAIIGTVALLGAAWAGNWGDIQGKTQAVWQAIEPVFNTVRGWLEENLPRALDWLGQTWQTWWPIIQSAVTVAWNSHILPALKQVQQWFNDVVPAALDFLGDRFQVWWPVIQQAVQTFWDIASVILSDLQVWFNDHVPGALDTVGGKFTEWWPVIQKAVNDFWTAAKPWLEALENLLGVLIKNALSDLKADFESAWPKIKKAIEDAKPPIQLAAQAITAVINGILGAVNAAKSAFDNFKAAWDSWFPQPKTVRVNSEYYTSGGSIPGFAGGGVMQRSGWALVGERGPELVQLPQGARVYNNRESRQMAGGDVYVTVQATVASDIDIEWMAREVARKIREHRR
jgi:tape measure domain-containing protein